MRTRRLRWRWIDPVRTAWLLHSATERMEVEDFEGALEQFQQVIGLDTSRENRLLAYQGMVVAGLRLGHYPEALVSSQDAAALLAAWPPEGLSEEVTAAREALEQAREFAQWALAHPLKAAALRERELHRRMEGPAPSPQPWPLGRATGWPTPVRLAYRLLVQSLLAAGLLTQATRRGELARRLLRAAGKAACFDRRLERDVYWHLSRLDERLGRERDAQAHRQRYEQLQQEVREVLRRLRWTN